MPAVVWRRKSLSRKTSSVFPFSAATGRHWKLPSVAPEASVICTGSTYASEKVGAYTPHREVRPMTMTIRTPTNIFVEVDMRRVE